MMHPASHKVFPDSGSPVGVVMWVMVADDRAPLFLPWILHLLKNPQTQEIYVHHVTDHLHRLKVKTTSKCGPLREV